MRALRPLIHLFTALVLLVQGVAVAAAERTLVPTDGQSPSVHVMPCHPQPVDQAAADDASPGKGSCCNHACPDMLSCAFVAVAVADGARMSLAGSSNESAGYTQLPYPLAPPGATLRPPIPLPA